MASYCDLINPETQNVITEGFVRNIKDRAVIEVRNLEHFTDELAPLSRVGVRLYDSLDIRYGFIYNTNIKTDVIIIGFSSEIESDKRKTVRIDVNEFTDLDIGQGLEIKHVPSIILNLSEGGLAFKSSYQAKTGDEIVYYFNKSVSNIMIKGDILWSRKEQDYHTYGVRFKNLTPEDSEVLYTYILSYIRDNLIRSEDRK